MRTILIICFTDSKKEKSMFKKLVFVIVLSGLFFGCSKSDDFDNTSGVSDKITKDLDNIIVSGMQDQNLPGVMVGIWIPGEGEYVKAVGTANLETGTHRKLTDRFRIGGITKTFTALRILQLNDEGRLSLDDTLSRYIPSFPRSGSITIRNLLNMNSGIKDYNSEKLLFDWYNKPLMRFSMDVGVSISARDSADFYPAGEKVEYCNTNYSILGMIIEQITGNTLAEEITQHIFVPLGMKNSVYPEDETLPGDLRGYCWNEPKYAFDDKTELNPGVMNAGGAIISDIYDLKRFAKALYNGELISEETHEEQIQTLPMDDHPEEVRYGLGIMQIGDFYGHNGTIFGFSTEMFYLPEKDAVIIINVNRLDLDGQSKSEPLFNKITKYLFPENVNW